MVDQSIIELIRRFLCVCDGEGLDVRFGVLFGSQAGGCARAESDIDVLVVSPVFDGPRDRRNIDRLWHLAARTDSRIEPIPCGLRQWDTDDGSAIIEIARSQGLRVDTPGVPGPPEPLRVGK